MNISRINVEQALPLRRDRLYPGQPLEIAKVDNDVDGLHFGVFVQGQLVTVGSLFLQQQVAQFRKLATHEACEGKGYASALLQHMAQFCRQEHISLLWCNARKTAESFYARLGYQRNGAYFLKNGITYCRMELPLNTTTTTNTFTIIPAIDIIDGKCVRLTQGDYAQQKVYNEHPLEVAMAFEDIGVSRLHLVDLDGARKGAVVNWKVLETLTSKTNLTIDFGGGIKTAKDLEIVFESGAALATIGSIAVKEPELFFSWLEQYGPDRIFLGADVKEENIAVSGWLETTSLSIYDFLERNQAAGIKHVFCTDIAKDGLLQGPSIELYQRILERFPDMQLTASGGVSNIADVAALREAGCSGVIIGKAIYEGKITTDELKAYL